MNELARALGQPVPVTSPEQIWEAICQAIPEYAMVAEDELNGVTPAQIQTIGREVAR